MVHMLHLIAKRTLHLVHLNASQFWGCHFLASTFPASTFPKTPSSESSATALVQPCLLFCARLPSRLSRLPTTQTTTRGITTTQDTLALTVTIPIGVGLAGMADMVTDMWVTSTTSTETTMRTATVAAATVATTAMVPTVVFTATTTMAMAATTMAILVSMEASIHAMVTAGMGMRPSFQVIAITLAGIGEATAVAFRANNYRLISPMRSQKAVKFAQQKLI